ncbi:MAG TPA: LysR substrate-binding domain-containing protein [Stellaceae bacterium]|nr:LysR substrate-binding domain-containing protein [Stellaceae bacterium]
MTDRAFDPALLTSFLAVARAGGFTEAGRRLGLGQSTVSQHVRRLETAVGRRLFRRDTHSVALTQDGEAMVGFAAAILDANDRARRHFAGSELRGRLRFGAPDDVVLNRVPLLLRDFRLRHQAVDLELTVALSGELYQKLEAGELDLILAKQRAGAEGALPLIRERQAWIGSEEMEIDRARPVPLILYRAPSVTRTMAIEALDAGGLAWREACTCGGLIGLHAAALAGLGVMVQSENTVPPGLTVLRSPILPPLGEIELVLVGKAVPLRGPAAALAASIREIYGGVSLPR